MHGVKRTLLLGTWSRRLLLSLGGEKALVGTFAIAPAARFIVGKMSHHGKSGKSYLLTLFQLAQLAFRALGKKNGFAKWINFANKYYFSLLP